MEKKLTRPMSEAKIAGVCAGIARYFGIDPTVVRLIWALCIIIGGAGILAYLICWLLMPKEL